MKMPRQTIQILLSLALVFAIGAPDTASEPPSRSIFQEARLTQPELESPVDPPKEERFLQSLGLGPIQIPETFGRVIDVYEGTSEKTIIHIQDAHVHYEAQKNLAAILESLIQRNHVRLVLVEGGQSRGELASLRKLASRESRREVAERYLRKGLLAGDAYLELVSDYPMVRQGIEDPGLYEENLRLFLEVERFKKTALRHLDDLRRLVEALKENLYGPAHQDLEKTRRAYEAEEMTLAEFHAYLAALKTSGKEADEPLKAYPNVAKLLEASELEGVIDFGRVAEERGLLIEVLSEKLSEEETGVFVDRSLSFQEGTFSQKAYYETLRHLAHQKSVSLDPYPNLEKYIAYLSLYGTIRHADLFAEGDRLEQDVRGALVRSEDERQLVAIDKHLKLLSSLFRLKVSPADYAAYRRNRLRFSVKASLPFLARKTEELGLAAEIPEEAVVLDDHLATLDRFYRIAQARDVAFVENSLEEMEKEGVDIAVLKTGGFHTPGLVRILKEKDISYLVISPRITEAGNSERYYSVLRESAGPRAR